MSITSAEIGSKLIIGRFPSLFHKEAFQLDQYTDEAHWSFYLIELTNDGVVIRCHEAGTQSSAKVFLIFLLIYLLLRNFQPTLAFVPSHPMKSILVTSICFYAQNAKRPFAISFAAPLAGTKWPEYLLPGSDKTVICPSIISFLARFSFRSFHHQSMILSSVEIDTFMFS